MIKAVVFDLDDTLISEKEYIKSGYRHIAGILSERYKINDEKTFEDLMELFIESSKNVFNRLLEKYEIDYTKEVIIDLVNEYRNHPTRILFYDDVLPCLEQLKGRGIKTGIITDGYAIAQRKKLEIISAVAYFDEIILTDELGSVFWKPHIKSFEMIRKKLDVEFEEMIYVGDNPEKDFYIRNICPVKTVRIYRDGVYVDREYFKGVKEEKSINSLIDIIEMIDS